MSGQPALLLIGASRGLGLAMAGEFVRHGWDVVGTVRGGGTPLHALAAEHPDRVCVETLDIDMPEQLAALSARLAGRRFDMLFVNAGVTNSDPAQTPAEVATDEFFRVMVTNALSPLRAIEALAGLVAADGTIGVMSSGQGSIANNTAGEREIYRMSKAALNMGLRSYAARAGGSRSLVAMAPGWVRTELGGGEAPLTIADSVPRLVEVLLARRGLPGIAYLDRFGAAVPW